MSLRTPLLASLFGRTGSTSILGYVEADPTGKDRDPQVAPGAGLPDSLQAGGTRVFVAVVSRLQQVSGEAIETLREG